MHDGTEGSLPVHALVLIKPLILNGHECLGKILRNVILADPFAVFLTGELLQGLLLPIVIVVINNAVKLHRQTIYIQIRLWFDDKI